MTLSELPYVLFTVVGVMAVLGWLALIVCPQKRWANFWVAGIIIPLLLGALYTLVMAVYWFQPPQGKVSEFLSLRGLQDLFQNPGLLLAGFIDLMVLPLVVGAWMARRGEIIRMPYWQLLVCFVLTLAVPGTGFVVFVLLDEAAKIKDKKKETEAVSGV